MMRTLLSLLFLIASLGMFAQSFTGGQKTQGYGVFGDKLTFIFDEGLYGVRPQRVFVTGEFRNWDQNLDAKEWELKKTGDQWLLTIDNTDFSVVAPNTKFKYRINEGEWLAPPESAANQKGGDLVFMKSDDRIPLKAELKGDNLIWAEINVERPLVPSAYRITDAKGKVIPVAGILPNESNTTLIVPAEPLDRKRVYFLEIPEQNLKVHCSFDGWFRETYSTKELGANIDNGQTTIRLFVPRADGVKLYLYKEKDDAPEEAYRVEELKEDAQGVWEIVIPEDLHGAYYDFTLHGSDDPGNFFYETNPVHINDPYARVSDDTWG
ncbi:MAG: pullulanase, partial [Bacteroidota bacterium]